MGSAKEISPTNSNVTSSEMFKEGKYLDIKTNITYNSIWFRDFCRMIVDLKCCAIFKMYSCLFLHDYLYDNK